MKKSIPLALILIALIIGVSACGGQRLNAVFKPTINGPALTQGAVQLRVTDQRPNRSLIGPAALEKDLFKESQSGLIDLTNTLPSGSSVTLTHVDIPQAVNEAIKQKLNLLGITVVPENSPAKALVTVAIKDLKLDLADGDILAKVFLEVEISRPGFPKTFRSRSSADSSKLKLVGDIGGSDVLGEALSRSINELDFSSLNNF